MENLTKILIRNIRTKNTQSDLANVAKIISLKAPDIFDKCEYPTGYDIVPSGQDKLVEQKEFELNPLQQTLDKKTTIIK